MKGKNEKTVGITVHVDPEKRLAFNAYAKERGFSPGNLIKNFIYTTVAEQKQVTAQ